MKVDSNNISLWCLRMGGVGIGACYDMPVLVNLEKSEMKKKKCRRQVWEMSYGWPR